MEKAPEILEDTIKCPEILNNFSAICLLVQILLYFMSKLHYSANEVHFLSHWKKQSLPPQANINVNKHQVGFGSFLSIDINSVYIKLLLKYTMKGKEKISYTQRDTFMLSHF